MVRGCHAHWAVADRDRSSRTVMHALWFAVCFQSIARSCLRSLRKRIRTTSRTRTPMPPRRMRSNRPRAMGRRALIFTYTLACTVFSIASRDVGIRASTTSRSSLISTHASQIEMSSRNRIRGDCDRAEIKPRVALFLSHSEDRRGLMTARPAHVSMVMFLNFFFFPLPSARSVIFLISS